MLFKEYSCSVLIVCASEKFGKQIEEMLRGSDYYPITIVKSAAEARRNTLERTYDIIIINTPLPDEFGARLAADIAADEKSGVLLFAKSELYEDVTAKVIDYGVLTLSKPTSASLIMQSVRLLYATSERLRRVNEKNASLEERMEEIRLINHAKWVLIEFMKMSENEAHHYIEKQAMDKRKSKKEIAEIIIQTYK